VYTRIILILAGLFFLILAGFAFVESGIGVFNPFMFLVGVLIGGLGEYCLYNAITGTYE
jgi:hypothetical protein